MTSINPFPVGALANAGDSPAQADETQLVALGLVNAAGALQATVGDDAGRVPTSSEDVIKSVLTELRTITAVLSDTLGFRTDLDVQRNDELSAISADVG